MSTMLSLLPMAGCGLMMWFCMRGMRGRSGASADSKPAGELEELRAEVAQLRSEISEAGFTASKDFGA